MKKKIYRMRCGKTKTRKYEREGKTYIRYSEK